MTTKKDKDFTPFHSAVNRIPVLRASGRRLAKHGGLPASLFVDGPAPGHDHLDPEHWSGAIDLEMTVRTPLVFGEQTEENGRSCIDLPTDERGNPLVPPTMVKGMISRAYENLTCSRFRVFGDHSEPLTYRADPAAANRLVPGRVCELDGGLGVEILDGFGKNAQVALIRDDLQEGHGEIELKKHPHLKAGPGGRLRPEQVFTRFRRLTPHGEQIEVQLTQWRDQKGTHHLMVTGVWDGDDLEVFFRVRGDHVQTFDVWGYTCRTAPEGKTAGQLFESKTYERFFFKSNRDGSSVDGTILPLNATHVSRYSRILGSYLEQQSLSGGDKHLLNRAATSSEPLQSGPSAGDLVFVRLQPDTDEISTESSVVNIFPTMVGRRTYLNSPRELAEQQNALPLSKGREASAADRLFGYVVPSAEEDAKGGDVSARGRITIGRVTAEGSPETTISYQPKELTPLLSPKPSSARRFLTDSSGKTPYGRDENDQPAALPRDGLFRQKQLLGSAAYPVHRRLLGNRDLDKSGFPLEATKAAVLNEQEQDNSAVRLKVRSWVKAGCVLRCTVSFSNLEKDELAALLWILTPENLVPQEEKGSSGAVGYLRMGLGKPLGLGAIEVRVADGGLRASKGKALAAGYSDLRGCLGEATPTVPVADYPLPKEDLLVRTPWVRAMQRAAFGYTDGVPVRYMTLEENKANNLTDPKTGNPKGGRGVSPTDLFDDDPQSSDKGPQPLKIKRSK